MPEVVKDKKLPPILKFQPEGYVSTHDLEYLDGLKKKLREEGVEKENLVYCGIDGSFLNSASKEMPERYASYGMNEAGWIETIRLGESSPAKHAEGKETPCIAVYDGDQLSEIYSWKITHEDKDIIEGTMGFEDVELGDALKDLSPTHAVTEGVAHVNYPNQPVNDALLCLVLV